MHPTGINDPEMRKRIVKVLLLARAYLWDGRECTNYTPRNAYICHCCDRADDDEAVWTIKKYIRDRLEGWSSFRGWLLNALGVNEVNQKHLQAHRRAWINELIKEFSK